MKLMILLLISLLLATGVEAGSKKKCTQPAVHFKKKKCVEKNCPSPAPPSAPPALPLEKKCTTYVPMMWRFL